MKFHGWLAGLSLQDGRAVLRFKTEMGERLQAWEPFWPHFYAVPGTRCAEELAWLVSQHPLVHATKAEKRFARLLDEEEKQVVRVEVERKSGFERVVQEVRRMEGVAGLAETQAPHAMKYVAEKAITFFAKYEVECADGRQGAETGGKGGQGRQGAGECARLLKLKQVQTEELPPLSCALVWKTANGFGLTQGGEERRVADTELQAWLQDNPTDALFSFGGDQFLQGTAGVRTNALGCFLEGVTHLDLRRDVGHDIYWENGQSHGKIGETPRELLAFARKRLPRVLELAKISGALPELIPRITAGRLNTYVHARAAKQRGFLLPDGKRLAETPKSLRLLKSLDRGGTVFYPEPGVYGNVAKLDFSSMYPNIIVKYNISPEMMHAPAGVPAHEVPEAGWRIRSDRQGVIPAGLQAVLERRLLLKKRMREERDPEKKAAWDVRQRALKNILVTCFGYLGFNNFVFSNVECKEAVMLYGRVLLRQAKEIAEEEGLQVVYGMVDSIFVAGGSARQYESYGERVSQEVGFELEHESVFSRIVFPASPNGAGAANKYYGIFEDGTLEARGIKWRHSDACVLAKKFQAEAMPLLLQEREWGEGVRKARALMEKYRTERHELEDYATVMSLRKPLEEYAGNVAHVKAARQMKDQAADDVAFVYSVHGPVPLEKARREEVDQRKYAHLLGQAFEELIRVPESMKLA